MADRLTPPGPAEPDAVTAPASDLPAQPNELHAPLKEMIVRVLMLEGVSPADIADDDPLFGEGLGLDSVDALELAIHIEESFGVKIPEDSSARTAFRSVSTLAAYILQARTAGGA